MAPEVPIDLSEYEDTDKSTEETVEDEGSETEDSLQTPEHATFTEIEPGKILVRMELLELHHGAPIPREVWEPLIGGETLRKELWDKILVNPGDEVYVKGSCTDYMLFGGYVLDKETGLAAENMRADIDMDIADTEIMARARAISSKTGYLSAKAEIANLEVDFADQEKIKQSMMASLLELAIQTEALPYEETQFLAHNAIADFTMLRQADPETVFGFNSFSRNEALAIRLFRNDSGELEATLADPVGSLEQPPEMDRDIFRAVGYADTIQDQRAIQIQSGRFERFEFRNPNPIGIYRSVMEAGLIMEKLRFTNLATPYYTNASIGRLIRNDCENNIRIVGEPQFSELLLQAGIEKPKPEYEEYLQLYYYAMRLNRGDQIYEIVNPTGGINVEENERLQRITRTKLQEEIARSAFSHPAKAMTYAFLNLPLGNFVSPEIAKDFEEMHTDHEKFPPSNSASIVFEEMDMHADNLTPDFNTAGTRTIVNIYDISKKFYGKKETEMMHIGTSNYLDEEARDEAAIHTTTWQRYPENMSEVMALLFVANGRRAESIDRAVVEATVANWMIEGKLGLTWKKTENTEFDVGMETKEILKKMKMFEDFLAEA